MKFTAEDHLEFWRPRLKDPTYVYIIRSGTAIKVGLANDVHQRMRELQCGNPVKLELMHVVAAADRRLEWFLHQKLRGARVRGEWFDGPKVPAFLDYVVDLAERMMAAYKFPDRTPPHYAEVDPTLKERPKPSQAPVTVSFVEPNPKSTPEEAAAIMQQVALGTHPLTRKAPRYGW